MHAGFANFLRFYCGNFGYQRKNNETKNNFYAKNTQGVFAEILREYVSVYGSFLRLWVRFFWGKFFEFQTLGRSVLV